MRMLHKRAITSRYAIVYENVTLMNELVDLELLMLIPSRVEIVYENVTHE
jgi:hypothetical protein